MSQISTTKSQKKERIRVNVGFSLDRRLSTYCIAAGCAGVAVTSVAQTGFQQTVHAGSQQTIQYYPANIQIVTPENHQNVMYAVDLNRDGINDFNFSAAESGSSQSGSLRYVASIVWGGLPAGAAAIDHLLSSGAQIGPNANFVNQDLLVKDTVVLRQHWNHYNSACVGQFNRANAPYLGIRFLISGETHYGWIRLSSIGCGPGLAHATISGYAYNTVANAPIGAGQIRSKASNTMRGSLGMLSLGAVGRE